VSWLFATLASTAIWIISFLVVTGAGPWILLFILIYWVPLIIVLSIAAVVARLVGRTRLRQVLVFYAFAVLLSGAILATLYAAAPNPHNRDAAFKMIFDAMLVPSLLSSIAYPLLVLRNKPA
jgi:hypothetical protein